MKFEASALILGVCCLTAAQCSGQRFGNWRSFRLGDGLPESACASVTISPQGKTLVRHIRAPMISELDGYGVNVIPTPERAIGRVYQSPGGQLWCLSPDGLKEARDGGWISHSVREIASQVRGADPANLSIVPLFPVRQGLVLFLLPDALMQFSTEHAGGEKVEMLRQANQVGLGQFSGLSLGPDGALWISAERGVARIANPRAPKPDSDWQNHELPAEMKLTNLREPRADTGGGVGFVAESGTNGQPMAVFFDGKSWTARAVGNEKLLAAWRGPENTYWALTRGGVLEWNDPSGPITESEEVSARQFFDAALEPGGPFWVATSDGLHRFAPLTWRNPPAVRSIKNPVNTLAADADGRVWFVAGMALHLVERETQREFAFPEKMARTLAGATALFPARNGALALEANGELFGFQTERGFFAIAPTGQGLDKFTVLGRLADGSLCVQRLAQGSGKPAGVELYDGARLSPFNQALPKPLSGRRLSAVFAARNGDLWMSGEKATACLHDDKWRPFISTDGSTPEQALSFLDLPDGKIWCATADTIWEFDGHNWVGLRRGFDRISSMIRTRDGSVWVASSGGLHRFLQSEWVENGTEDGLASTSVRALCEDQAGKLWAATTHGIDWFCPEADADPPRTVIEAFSDEEKNLAEGQSLNIAYSAIDKWKYTQRGRLLFSHRIDQKEWSPFQETMRASFSDLASGKHYFQVRAMDRNFNIDPKPAQYEFSVVLPWYREKRLVLISAACAAAVLFFAALAFNRHLRLLRSYAEIERKVTQRTSELEMANRELLHSQKMNALGTLAAGIAHDFNNILSIIKGSAQIIEENLEDSRKVRTRVDRIKTVVEQGAGIVKAMLGFSRDSGEAAGPCDLNAAVQDTLKLLGDRFLREVQVAFEPSQGLPPAACSKEFVQQILLNFIFNAAESMTRRRQIRISTAQSQALPSGMVLMPAQSPAYASICVQDFGCGISAETLPRIFEPFFTTKAFSSRRGTGLGLSMVYELAKKMDAGLAVESLIDQGSTFTLVIPIQQPEGEARGEAPKPELEAVKA
jgi:signal transduction histidine kinase